MLIDKILGSEPAVDGEKAAGNPLAAPRTGKHLFERIIRWVLFLLATVSVFTTVAIIAVLLFEGVQFFASDFYETKSVKGQAVSEAAAVTDSLGTVGTGTLAPGIVPRVETRSTTDSLIYVSWEAPTSGDTPTGYDVSILPVLVTNVSDCENLAADRSSCVISNASPGRSYRVSVSVLHGVGMGPAVQTSSFAVPESVKWWRFFTDLKWRTLLVPRSYGIWPLLVGTLMIAVLAMFIAVPLGLLSAIFLSEYAPPRMRAITKPILEVLAGVPTVVYGFFALFFITPLLREVAGNQHVDIFNALAASIVMGVMIVPMVSSLSEDAMRAVPQSLREGAYALGATKVEVTTRVVVPGALSGIVAAFILAMSRAVGETMIVFIAAGQNDKLTFNPLDPVNTMTGFMATTNFSDNAIPGTAQFQSLFAVGIALFVLTLLMNLLSQFVVTRFREVYE